LCLAATHPAPPLAAPLPAPRQALPLVLDRLADPLTAVVLSTTVVLVFGEILPQAACTRYGLQVGGWGGPRWVCSRVGRRRARGPARAGPLPGPPPVPLPAAPLPPNQPAQIGAAMAWFVRLLMFICAPLAWPIGKSLDFLLGGEHTVRRRGGGGLPLGAEQGSRGHER
jgi:metal transporter CNNM